MQPFGYQTQAGLLHPFKFIKQFVLVIAAEWQGRFVNYHLGMRQRFDFAQVDHKGLMDLHKVLLRQIHQKIAEVGTHDVLALGCYDIQVVMIALQP